MSFILVTAVGLGVLAAPYTAVVGAMYRFKVVNVFKYKIVKRRLYKSIYKAIQEEDIQSLRDSFENLARFDSKYDRQKCSNLKKKLGICDEILADRRIFKLKFDTDYLIEHCQKIINIKTDSPDFKCESNDSLISLKIQKTKNGLSPETILKEKELIKREKMLEMKEKEIAEILENLRLAGKL